ncbi:carboxypeptidase-like regulatory domain-containing protein [Aurantibacillus circumpalustris]|uniref:carboxypeptidase-like regulatory domain-containing protein n=1 Tax=Aurantibacillus circumpalustris TaxID=3036359 RepID=UPI00295AAB88|nr:carboxypeptidase-like regulatory domain-containing protein [Aurantibacillus circumpalustris]
MKKRIKTIIALCLVTALGIAQTKSVAKSPPTLIQFSGMVLDQDSLTPIPFVSIVIKGTERGTVSLVNGFFSLIIKSGDEIQFSSITHKSRSYKISDTLKQKYYYAIQVLTKDTFELPTVEIYSWPTRDEFKRAFLALDLNDTDGDRADKNLTREELSYLERTQTASASENYKYVMQAYYTKVYTSGQQPMNNLLNPIKWAEFINSWRSGKLSANPKKKTN